MDGETASEDEEASHICRRRGLKSGKIRTTASLLTEALDIHRDLMLHHLQELVENTEYGWRVVRDYHAAWLQQIEQDKAA